jgi:transposase
VSTKLSEAYLDGLSQHRPKEFKLVVIDNAGFHSTKNMTVPANIFLLNIPAYSPELSPCEQVWAYMKTRFKNKVFTTMEDLKEWLYKSVKNLSKATILSITSNHHFLSELNAVFKI